MTIKKVFLFVSVEWILLFATVTQSAVTHNIAFGSCLRQWQDQPIWKSIQRLESEAFIFLGDNVYSDVGRYLLLSEPGRIGSAYEHLSRQREFDSFRQDARARGMPLFATWDDHDYGRNDGGANYPHKLASKQFFLDFFDIGAAKTDPEVAGIYHSNYLQIDNLNVQFLMLDTRSFRSELLQGEPDLDCPRRKISPNSEAGATILGEVQWQWLESQLQQPADLRIIASSIQVIPVEHCFEKWANFPAERERLFTVIKQTKASGVVFISGDRHLAEISLLPRREIGYPLYEVTSSGLNSAMGENSQGRKEKNQFRALESNVLVNNFATIGIDRSRSGTQLKLQIHDEAGHVRQSISVDLSELRAEPEVHKAEDSGGT